MDTEARRALHAALCKIRDEGPRDPFKGLIVNIDNILDKAISSYIHLKVFCLWHELIARWPERINGTGFPVEGSKRAYLSAEATANRYNPEHPWGARRLRLLDWMIEETRDDAR